MSTATRTSKFGIALDDPGNRARILTAYRERPWLTCVHTHVGSQGCPLELIAGGIAKAAALAREINSAAGRRQVTTLDIGGGLPVNFESEDVTPSFAEYAAILRHNHGARPAGCAARVKQLLRYWTAAELLGPDRKSWLQEQDGERLFDRLRAAGGLPAEPASSRASA